MAPWDAYGQEIQSLAIYGVGIALYTLAVIFLYVPLSSRMMFARRLGQREVATPARRFAYVLLFPVFSFAFFLMVAGSMVFMASFSQGDLTPRDVMTIAMAIVLATRICAYFSENAAQDLARVMPLGLLGVILVTNQFATLRESLENLRAFGEDLELLAIYFVIVIVTEFTLRIVYEALGRPTRPRGTPPARGPPGPRRA